MTPSLKAALHTRGVEILGDGPELPAHCVLEPPCSLKWMQIVHSLEMGAFSYAVSGYFHAVRIGRYVSIGEQVQIGRHNHPMSWMSTSPFFYNREPMFDIGRDFEGAEGYDSYSPTPDKKARIRTQVTTIGNDVWIGHGAWIKPGIAVGDGAVVGAHSVVTKDVPPYAIVAGNPAVVKKYRLPEELIPRMLRSQWWQYAPWDLKGMTHHAPKTFLRELKARRPDLQPYAPLKIIPAEIIAQLA